MSRVRFAHHTFRSARLSQTLCANMIRILPLLLVLLGCSDNIVPDSSGLASNGSAEAASIEPPGRIERRESDPVIADDPRLEQLIGSWFEEDNDRPLTITRNADGSVTVFHPYPFDLWDSVVDNVRFEQDKLHYDVYHYYNGPHKFSTDSGDHPFSGKLNEMAVAPGPANDTLTWYYLGLETELSRSQ